MAKKVLLKVGAGDPTPTYKKDAIYSNRGQFDTFLDLRDKLAELAVQGRNLHPDDRAAIYGYFANALGPERAQKVITHAQLFNSRPDVQGLSPEEKLKSFYTIGSNDPDVQQLITKTKSLGYGVIPGYRGSSSAINQATQQGNYNNAVGAIDPMSQKKVMLRVGK
jgi:hypothetical protein